METETIAECPIRLVFPDGRDTPSRIVVRRPRVVDDRESRCAFTILGLTKEDFSIGGGDTLQALLLALRMMSRLLADFEQGGGKILFPEGVPFDLEPYFGGLLRPRAAFLRTEVEWLRFDVTSALTHSGLGVARSSERPQCSHWLSKKGYAKLAIDCSQGKREVQRQLGSHLKWEEQFGYRLEDGPGNLDAIRDGFNFDLGDLRGFALEILEPEATWKEDGPWFEGLLAVAVEHARYQLALGHRFLVVLYVAESSPLVGRVVEPITIPSAWSAPLGAPANWSTQ
jgi:hypothetical protein